MVEGIRLADERRIALAALIPSNPKLALDHAVPMPIRQALPPDIVARLETRVNTKGFYGVLGIAPDPLAPGLAAEPPIRREVRLADGKRYQAHVYGARLRQPTTPTAHLNGIAIDRSLALDERPLRVLENGERPDALLPTFKTCPISGKSVTVSATDDGAPAPITEDTPAVEVGGEIHYLCHGGHIIAFEERLIAEEGKSGGPVKTTTTIASTDSTGVRTILYMRLAFPETNQAPQTEAAAYEMMREVNDFMVESSYGNVYLLTTVTPLIILPHSEAWYNGGGGDEYAVRNDAIVSARQMGYDTSQYDLDIVVYHGGPGNFGGLGYVLGKGVWLKNISVGVACHELGHNFGLWHANSWNTGGQSVIGNGTNSEYGNIFDTMGVANAGDYHFNANHKSQLNWLPTQTYVHPASASGTYRVYAFDQPLLDPARRYALKIRKDTAREYWAEFRQKSFVGNPWVKDGILLNWSPWANSTGGAQLLDTTPGSADDRNDAPIVIGRTFSDFESGIHITPIGKGGTTPESMDVVVNIGAFPGNQPPTLSVGSSTTNVATGASVSFTATASDPDNDPLSYAWDFGDRTVGNTNSPSISKSWSNPGDYLVRCIVSDMKGHTASRSVAVRVGSPATFRVSGTIMLGGQPLADVLVSNGASGAAFRGAYTNTDGTFAITGLNAGSVTLSAVLNAFSFSATFSNPVTVGPDFTGANFTAAATPTVTLVVSDPDCEEGTTNPGRFTLTRTGSTTAGMTVNFFAPTGTATKGADYTLSPDLFSGSAIYPATIPAGQSAIDIVVSATADATAEGPETVTLELAPGSGYVIAGAQVATLTIIDSDTSLAVVAMRVADAEANEIGGDTAAFVITRTGATSSALTVAFTLSGTATVGVDYANPGSNVVIPIGQSSALVTILPVNDTLAEGTETVTLTLSTDAAYILTGNTADRSGTINILDDDIATLTVAAADSSASEGGGDTGTFVVTRTGSTAQALTVNYALDGSATHGVDYVPLPGVLTIAAGSRVGTVTVIPIDDDLGEPDETVALQLRASATYVVGNPGIATVTIADNGDAPVVSIGVNNGYASEPDIAGSFRFTTRGSGTGNITIHYAVTGSATPGSDYVTLPGTLSMGRNSTADVALIPIDDTAFEGFETITVTLIPDAAYTLFLETTATIHLADDEQPMVSVSSTSAIASESSGYIAFWIYRTGSTASALTVNYTMGGTATNAVDYANLPGTISIPQGASGVLITTNPINDTLKEGTETVILNLAAGAYGIGISSAMQTLADNDPFTFQVKFSTGLSSASESAGTVYIPVVLTAASAGEVRIDYIVNGGTATGGVDYSLTPGTLVFLAGETSKSIPVTIVDDAYAEANQTVIIRLQNPSGASLGSSPASYTHTLTITDNDLAPPPTIAFAAVASSGSEAVAQPAVVVSLSAVQASAVTVGYAVTGGTATSGSDFTLASGTLTIAAGETAAVLPLVIINDAVLEPDETIIVALNNPSGASLGANVSHTYTIIDVEPAAISITATDATAAETGNDTGLFTLTRVGSTASALTVNITVAGTATNGTDFQTIPATVAFAPSAATATVQVHALTDSLSEGSETVIVTIATGPGYTVGTPSSATVTIADEPLDGWRMLHFGPNANNPAIAGDMANVDGDALVNLLEFALAGDPHVPDASVFPFIGLEGGDVTLTYRRPNNVGSLLYAIDAWTSNGWEPVGFAENILSDDGTYRVVKNRVQRQGAISKMLRLRVEHP